MKLIQIMFSVASMSACLGVVGCSSDDSNGAPYGTGDGGNPGTSGGDAGGGNTSDAGSDSGSGSAQATLSTQGTLGAHLVDRNGKTLYFFAKDVPGATTPACNTACQATWPLASLGTVTTVGDGLKASDFGTVGTTTQTTWLGRPLYYFKNDSTAGATAGEAIGGIWFVARAYNLFFGVNTNIANAPQGAADKTGTFLTDGKGRTVYVLQTETPANGATPPVTKCGVDDNAACAAKWPAWQKPASVTTPVVPSTVNAQDLGSFAAEGNKTQFTYKGWPTYFFAPDSVTQEAPGQVNGAAVPNWHAVNFAWNGMF